MDMHMGRTTIKRITRIVFLVWLIVTAILLWHSIRPRYPVPHARPGALHALRDGWSLHILAEDCRTVLVGYRSVRDQEMLLRIVAKLHRGPAHAVEGIRRYGRGSVWIDSSPAQCRALGIRLRPRCPARAVRPRSICDPDVAL